LAVTQKQKEKTNIGITRKERKEKKEKEKESQGSGSNENHIDPINHNAFLSIKPDFETRLDSQLNPRLRRKRRK